MMRNDVPLGKGQCDIRLQVDNEVEVAVRRDTVMVRTISGRDARDDGSECNAPLPDRDPLGFHFEVKDSRNEIRLMDEPSRRNDFTAVVHIRDSDSGYGRYHFRLSWDMAATDSRTGADSRPGPDGDHRDGDHRDGARPDGGRPGGFVWNNVVNFRGQGRGQTSVNDYSPQRLSDVSVDIDRGGKIAVSFRADRRPLVFAGIVIGQDGGRIKADVATEDGRLRGPMYISVDDRQNVNSITLEATDGRDRLRLNWDRR
jgi:hypothetical protein